MSAVQDAVVTLIAAAAAISIVMRAIALSVSTKPPSACASCPAARKPHSCS